MSAYVNGAISALNKILEFLDSLDPDKQDTFLNSLRERIDIYEEIYLEMDRRTPPEDTTWDNIKKANQIDEDPEEVFQKIQKIFKA